VVPRGLRTDGRQPDVAAEMHPDVVFDTAPSGSLKRSRRWAHRCAPCACGSDRSARFFSATQRTAPQQTRLVSAPRPGEFAFPPRTATATPRTDVAARALIARAFGLNDRHARCSRAFPEISKLPPRRAYPLSPDPRLPHRRRGSAQRGFRFAPLHTARRKSEGIKGRQT